MTGPLLAYYGDDFTGSADVMEVLQWSGLRTVLFLRPPTPAQLASFGELPAFGIAGWGRTMSPAEMEAELKPALQQLRESGASIVHYKTCSTFDSSPEIGSIGKALELGCEVFDSGVVPMVVAAPNLGRYQVFGNLFARSGLDSRPYRLDRHPTMRHHPITPMTEADLRLHLAAQTELKIGLVDVLQLDVLQLDGANGPDDITPDSLGCDALLFDALYPEHLPRIGQAIEKLAPAERSQFVVGSSGMEYALAAHWAVSGRLESWRTHAAGRPTFGAAERLVVITGSCSPVNDRQIAWAEQNEFETIRLNTARLIETGTSEREIASSVERALELIRAGANVILHSSRGPADPRIEETTAVLRSRGESDLDIKRRSGAALGPQLGKILQGILREHPFSRVGVAGGDTSGYVARELGITALEAIAPLAPGSPLCRAHADGPLNGVEFFFKGGQVGRDDVWGTTLRGTQEVEDGRSSARAAQASDSHT